MKIFLLSLFILGGSSIGSPSTGYAGPSSGKAVEVQMKSISFAPKTIEITAGDSVVWKNVSYTDHSATGEGFDTGMVKPKEHSKAILFSTPGTYGYHCKVHGKTMSGTVQVDAK